jgi:hypothetical protein
MREDNLMKYKVKYVKQFQRMSSLDCENFILSYR